MVKLPAQMSTGYGWRRAGKESGILAFIGAASLEFQYRRPWEKFIPPDKIFRIKVTVAGG